MSEKLVRALLAGTPSSVPPSPDSAPPSRLGAYLDRAYSALAGARGLARSQSSAVSEARVGQELERAARELYRGVRIAQGLSPTRERDLRVLLYGAPTRSVEGLAGLWARKLEPLCAVAGGAVARDDASRWIEQLQKLIDEARTLRAIPRPRRDGRRTR